MSGILAALAARGGAKVTLGSDTIDAIAIHPAGATATLAIGNNGVATETPGGSYNWLTGGIPSAYEINATFTGGTTPTGGDSLGSWLNLGTSRSWSLTHSGVVSTTHSDLSLQIRPVGGSVVASATVTLQVDIE